MNTTTQTATADQQRQVEHYLSLWEAHPSRDNWHRVIEAALNYRPAGPFRVGQYASVRYDLDRAVLRRVVSVGPRGGIRWARYYRTTKSWRTQAT
jgi:hypothetical protein